MKGTIFLNEKEVFYLFKLLLNMDHNDEMRTAIFKKIEELYLETT